MLTRADLRRLALALPGASEEPHFDLTSYRVGKKIFATVGEARRPELMLKLDPEDQANLCDAEPEVFAPVPGGWGRKGATFVRFEALDEARLASLIRTAWAKVAPKHLLTAQPPG